MKKLKLTEHGERRANQRGFCDGDFELIRRCGTLVEDPEAESYLVLKKDVKRNKSELNKRQTQRLERLCGCKVVIANNQLVTAYHTSRAHEKSLLRRSS